MKSVQSLSSPHMTKSYKHLSPAEPWQHWLVGFYIDWCPRYHFHCFRSSILFCPNKREFRVLFLRSFVFISLASQRSLIHFINWWNWVIFWGILEGCRLQPSCATHRMWVCIISKLKKTSKLQRGLTCYPSLVLCSPWADRSSVLVDPWN